VAEEIRAVKMSCEVAAARYHGDDEHGESAGERRAKNALMQVAFGLIADKRG